MSKSFKKIVAFVCAIAMVVSSITIYNSTDVKAVDWSDTSAWTSVTVGGTEYKLTSDNAWVVGFTTHGAATGYMTVDALWCNFQDAAYTKAVLNGVTYASEDCKEASDTVRFMGAQVWWNPALCSAKQNELKIYNNDELKDTVYIYNPNGTGEVTTPDPDATTTTPESTTTKEQTAPVMQGNPLIQINDFGNGNILFVAGLDVIQGATTYNLYVDGELHGAVTNGANIALTEFTPGEHLFQVTGVNEAGESDKSEGYTITIPNAAGEDDTTPAESSAPVETTTAAEQETIDPDTIKDWTSVTGSTTVSYYICDNKGDIVTVKPQVEVDNIYTAYNLAAPFSSVTVNGDAKDVPEGAFYRLYFTDIAAAGYYTVEVTDAYSTESVTIIYKVTEEEATTPAETTTAPEEDEDGYSTDAGVWTITMKEGKNVSAKHKNQDALEDYYVKVATGEGAGSEDAANIMSSAQVSGLKSGYVYDYTINLNASESAYIGTGITESGLLVTTIETGDNAVTGSFKATADTENLILALGHSACSGKTFHVTGVTITEHVATDTPLVGKKWTAWSMDNTAFRVISEDPSTYTYTGSIGDNWYSIQTQIDNVLFEAGKNYVCTFTLKASNPKEFRVDNRITGDPKLSSSAEMVETVSKWYQIDGDTENWYCDFSGFYPATSEHEFKNVRISLGYFDGTNSQTGNADNTENYAANTTGTFELVNFSLTAKAAENEITESTLSIEGFQMTIGTIYENGTGKQFNGGIRTVYSVPDTINGQDVSTYERGLVYGLKGSVSKDEVVLNSDSLYVKAAPATSKGVISESYGQTDKKLYAMIMATDIEKLSAAAINREIYVRAYVKAGDTYYYSDVKSYSIYNIADVLYQNSYMQTEAGHTALYTNFLSKANANYATIPYNYNKDWLYEGADAE